MIQNIGKGRIRPAPDGLGSVSLQRVELRHLNILSNSLSGSISPDESREKSDMSSSTSKSEMSSSNSKSTCHVSISQPAIQETATAPISLLLSAKPLPSAFVAKKATILGYLAEPVATYTDASPKGSIDVAIRGLIDRINALEGIVTTSSCAGRVSVFLEGKKNREANDELRHTDGHPSAGAGVDDADAGNQLKSVPGGKGSGGRWLFVSHEPIDAQAKTQQGGLTTLFGIKNEAREERCDHSPLDNARYQKRLVRFQFEPMILHIMAASLYHAQRVLAAAINAGFRESGVQSLKNLNDANAFPMVAVRTSGLAFESLIGFTERSGQVEIVQSLVSEDYLGILVDIANERFGANTERIKRFEQELFCQSSKSVVWEDAESRKARKRAEGLARQAILQRSHGKCNNTTILSEDLKLSNGAESEATSARTPM